MIVNELVPSDVMASNALGTENVKIALPEPVEVEQTILDVPEHEPIDDHKMAVGRVMIESLAAALPQFPRAAGAELEQTEAAPAGGGKVNPFAALEGWKPKPK